MRNRNTRNSDKHNITVRLDDQEYLFLNQFAKAENRSLANLIITSAMEKLEEKQFTDSFETEEIMMDQELLDKLNRGHNEAQNKKGRFVD